MTTTVLFYRNNIMYQAEVEFSDQLSREENLKKAHKELQEIPIEQLCRDHDYELIDKEVKEPPLYEMIRNGIKLTVIDNQTVEALTTQTVSRMLKCKKCNKIWIDTIKI